MIAFTSAWGSYSRNRGLARRGQRRRGPGRRTTRSSRSTRPAAGAGAIPDDGFVLVGRDARRGRDPRARSPATPATLTLRPQGRGRARRCSSRSAATSRSSRTARRAGRPLDTVRRPAHRDRLQGRRQDDAARHRRRPAGAGCAASTLDQQAARRSSRSAPRPRSTSTAAARRRWSPARSATTPRRVRNTPVRRPRAPRPERRRRVRHAGRRQVVDEPRSSRRRTPRVFPGLHRTLTGQGRRRPRHAGRRPVDVAGRAPPSGVVTRSGATPRQGHRRRRRPAPPRRRTDVRVLGPLQALELSTARLVVRRRDASRRAARCGHGPRRPGLHRPDRARRPDLDYDHVAAEDRAGRAACCRSRR